MMNKAQSARVHLIRFLFLLPLLVVVLLAFRNTTQIHRQALRALVTDTIPTAEKIYPGWKDMETIDVNDSKVTVRLKNKKIETYDLSNTKEREAFEQKYGPIPTPPPPPPAPTVKRDLEIKEAPEAPEAPEKPELREAPEKPEAPEAPEKLELSIAPKAPEAVTVAPVPPPPPPPVPAQDCYNQKGFCINVVDNHGEATVIVKDKDNKIVLAVSLTDWNKDKQQYEDKYGEVPTQQIRLLPKVVMGYKIKPVIIKTADGRTEENIIAVNSYNTVYRRKYVPMYSITPDSNIHAVRIVRGHPYPLVKVAVQPKIAAEAKVTAETKVAAEVKAATDAKVKTEAEAREAAQPKPAAPTKEP